MREIKFRCYLTPQCIKEEALNKAYFDKIGHMFDVDVIDFENETVSFRTPSLIDNVPFDHIFLMQYIGIKDKSGKEIYEGDILQYQAEGWEVSLGCVPVSNILIESKMGESCGCCRIVLGWNLDDCSSKDISNEFKVIGNIHDNPELIPGKDK